MRSALVFIILFIDLRSKGTENGIKSFFMKNLLKTTTEKIYLILLFSLWITVHFGCNTNNRDKPTETKSDIPVITKDSLPPITDAATILNRPEVIVLCYHQLRDFRPSDSKRDRDY